MYFRFVALCITLGIALPALGQSGAGDDWRSPHNAPRRMMAAVAQSTETARNLGPASARRAVTFQLHYPGTEDGPGFALVLAANRATGEIVSGANQRGSNGNFTLDLDDGAYDVFVWEGLILPTLYEDIRISSDTTVARTFERIGWNEQGFAPILNPAPSTSFLRYDGPSPLSVSFDLDTAVDSVFLLNARSVHTVNGKKLLRIPLVIDGSTAMLSAEAAPDPNRFWDQGNTTTEARLQYAVSYTNGQAVVRPLASDVVSYVVRASIPTEPILASGPGWQATEHLINIYEPDFADIDFGNRYAERAIGLMEAAPDAVGVFSTRSSVKAVPGLAGGFANVWNNSDRGIGLEEITLPDPTFRQTRGRVFFTASSIPATIHEFTHLWAAYDIEPLNTSQFGSHWGISDVYGILGGYKPDTETLLADGTVRVPIAAGFGRTVPGTQLLADLERYLIGVLPADELRASYTVLDDADTDPLRVSSQKIFSTAAT